MSNTSETQLEAQPNKLWGFAFGKPQKNLMGGQREDLSAEMLSLEHRPCSKGASSHLKEVCVRESLRNECSAEGVCSFSGDLGGGNSFLQQPTRPLSEHILASCRLSSKYLMRAAQTLVLLKKAMNFYLAGPSYQEKKLSLWEKCHRK